MWGSLSLQRGKENQHQFPPFAENLKKSNIQITYPHAMISVLAQERLLGAALGSILTGIVVFEQRRCIYSSISGTKPQSITQSQVREPLFGRKTRSEFAHLWNKAVDQTFRPVIESLSSSGW